MSSCVRVVSEEINNTSEKATKDLLRLHLKQIVVIAT
jgi:hypothetical protein